ncbi:uncharacterized protein SPAPADRAFT_48209 [Spathaspora passalidarum NRRL Y-27907]|uniref:CENP-T/Histone H4 histone fold domain-containing protein n=1 Tax=Spathaspora passalidarum (strain NRRL Y-27907 / 11-Y1) TaxID=619300 RepID=G3AG37_SPAPN|nr:uncharacterized protein SPAPADRAFT_48209 [Spathaspora passalidarum NRRL Y-27907]EGW35176.1 hypothetical protein SPAPADRAFT_48209 [Spathaspora passalidarum NRRL Y-27907]
MSDRSMSNPTTPRRARTSSDYVESTPIEQTRRHSFNPTNLRLPTHEMPQLPTRYSSEFRPRSRPRSNRSTPNRQSLTPVRRRSLTPRRTSLINSRNRRSSIVVIDGGEKVFMGDYRGPISNEFLLYFCKVDQKRKRQQEEIQQRREVDEPRRVPQDPFRVEQGELVRLSVYEPKQEQIQEPQSEQHPIHEQEHIFANNNIASTTPIRRFSRAPTSSPAEFDQSLPLPQQDHLLSPAVVTKIASTPQKSKPNPKPLSYLQKILLAKSKQAPPTELKSPLETRIEHDIPVHEDIIQRESPIIPDRTSFTIRQSLVPGVNLLESEFIPTTPAKEVPFEIHVDEPMHHRPMTEQQPQPPAFEDTSQEDKENHQAEAVENIQLPTNDMDQEQGFDFAIMDDDQEPIETEQDITSDHDLPTAEESQITPPPREETPPVPGSYFDTVTPPRTRSGSSSPAEFIHHEYSLDHHDESIFDEELASPSNVPTTLGDVPTVPRKQLPSMRAPSKPRKKSEIIPSSVNYSDMAHIVKTIQAQHVNGGKRRKRNPSSEIINSIREKADSFLDSLMTDLQAYAEHRSDYENVEINMSDVLLYLRRVNLTGESELDIISTLAQKFLPLESLISLDNDLYNYLQ